MNIRVELEIERPIGYEDVTDEQLCEWAEYCLGLTAQIPIKNPLSDGTPLSEGIIENETVIGYI
jgi:hypothetical protein